MNLKRWLEKRLLEEAPDIKKDLGQFIRLANRDLSDASVEAVSLDRRFATAYGAALGLASLVIGSAGYRVVAKRGHHKVTFEAAAEILGKDANEILNYFDICRRKRNKVDYDMTDVVTETEVVELIEAVRNFKALVESRFKI